MSDLLKEAQYYSKDRMLTLTEAATVKQEEVSIVEEMHQRFSEPPRSGTFADLHEQECQQRLFNGTLCRRPVVTTVPLDFTDERKPVCKRHADTD